MRSTKFIPRTLTAGCATILLALASAGVVTAEPSRPSSSNGTGTSSGVYSPKGLPPAVNTDPTVTTRPQVITSPADGSFFYGLAEQEHVVADGAHGYYTIDKPYVASTDFHSLAELAVQDDAQRQVIEVGWTVDPGLNGDFEPHLFVYHWINGVRTCYNACGFVPVANAQGYTAGMKLPVTSTPVQFSILHHGTAWLVGFNGHTFGYFPDSLWSSTFTLTGLVQWFGEVAAKVGETSPCTQMGNGQFGESAGAARIERIGYAPSRVDLNPVSRQTDEDLFSIVHTRFDGYRYGGSGAACRTVPDIIGQPALPATAATHIITFANLTVGTVATVTDPLCEDIGKIVSQTPVAGTHVSPGTTVSYTYAVAPTSGCPNPPR